ncbi:hypothetical protein LZ32DRAFT_611490 [Colletotrichum eremochloae]|nr:hypothetical protein LZ32DRAFT_611490 [Colletotrichum eremochloae]
MDFFLKHVPRLGTFGRNCLGHLATYRMTIEVDPEARHYWKKASESWYNEAKKTTSRTRASIPGLKPRRLLSSFGAKKKGYRKWNRLRG